MIKSAPPVQPAGRGGFEATGIEATKPGKKRRRRYWEDLWNRSWAKKKINKSKGGYDSGGQSSRWIKCSSGVKL